jgi:hypothetical protein
VFFFAKSNAPAVFSVKESCARLNGTGKDAGQELNARWSMSREPIIPIAIGTPKKPPKKNRLHTKRMKPTLQIWLLFYD